MVVPDLNPLIDQLLRHYELDSKATKIMPWVYSSCTEELVADYDNDIELTAFTGLDGEDFHEAR